MTNSSTTEKKEGVCNNNCEQLCSMEDKLTDKYNFKQVQLFEGEKEMATFPLHIHPDYCYTPFKDCNELFEELDRLNEENSEIPDFEENEVEKIMYRMFPLDYSSSFNIDGIATDDFGKQFVLVYLDESGNTNVPCTINSDGMLINNEEPDNYKDVCSKVKKLIKDKIRKQLKKVAYINSDINDLSIDNETTYDEFMEEKKKLDELKEDVWKLYNTYHNKYNYYNNKPTNEELTKITHDCNNTDIKEKRQKNTSETKVRGPQKKELFVNQQTQLREKQRFMNYLSKHKMGNRELSSNKDDMLNEMITCFITEWAEQNMLVNNYSGAAIFRFLHEDCKIKANITEKTYSNKIKKRIRNKDYNQATLREIRKLF